VPGEELLPLDVRVELHTLYPTLYKITPVWDGNWVLVAVHCHYRTTCGSRTAFVRLLYSRVQFPLFGLFHGSLLMGWLLIFTLPFLMPAL